MCQKLPASWFEEPRANSCPRCFPSLFERPTGTQYYKECPCNQRACKHCRDRRMGQKLFKAIQAFRGRSWQVTIVQAGSPERHRLLRALRKHRKIYVSVKIGRQVTFYHEAMDGPRSAWKPAFVAFRALATRPEVDQVRFSRNFPKLTAEIRQAQDRRALGQKHIRLGSSRFSRRAFHQNANEIVDARIVNGQNLERATVERLVLFHLLPRGCYPTAQDCALAAFCGATLADTHTARTAHDGRIWRNPGGQDPPIPW